MSILSEALYYSGKLLICVTGVPAPLFLGDTGNKRKNPNNPQTYSAYIGGQEFPFGCRYCNSCHNNRSKWGKDFIDDFQIQSRNAIKSMLAQAHVITWRKSSFTY